MDQRNYLCHLYHALHPSDQHVGDNGLSRVRVPILFMLQVCDGVYLHGCTQLCVLTVTLQTLQ